MIPPRTRDRHPPVEQADVAGFRRDGATGVTGLVDADEVRWLAEIADRLVADGHGHDLAGRDDGTAPRRLPQVMAPQHHAPELLDATFLPRAEALGRRLVGDDAVTTIAMLIVKPARDGAATPWHQDAVYWHRTDAEGRPVRHRAASIWIPLQPATVANGCMQFVLGSHRRDGDAVLPHRHVEDDPDIHARELSPEARHAVVDPIALELPAGGASVHDGYTLHFAGPNTTFRPRRALILAVRAPEVLADA